MHATLVIMAPLLIQSNNRSIWLISWNETVYEEEQETGGRIGVLKLRIVPARLRFLPMRQPPLLRFHISWSSSFGV